MAKKKNKKKDGKKKDKKKALKKLALKKKDIKKVGKKKGSKKDKKKQEKAKLKQPKAKKNQKKPKKIEEAKISVQTVAAPKSGDDVSASYSARDAIYKLRSINTLEGVSAFAEGEKRKTVLHAVGVAQRRIERLA
jgi:hypothetical protein